jgi:hypothetical protein
MKPEKQKWSRKDWYMFAVAVTFIPLIFGYLLASTAGNLPSGFIGSEVSIFITGIGKILVNLGVATALLSIMLIGNVLSHEIDESQLKDKEIMELKIEIERMKKDNRFNKETLEELHTESQKLLVNHIKDGGKK